VDKFVDILDGPGIVLLILMLPLILCLVFAFADGLDKNNAVRDCIEATKEVAECAEMWK
jgi:hypothetical protein